MFHLVEIVADALIVAVEEVADIEHHINLVGTGLDSQTDFSHLDLDKAL